LKKRGEMLRPWTKRVELPTFEGSDPLGWITHVELFFEVQNVNHEDKLLSALIRMEGNANHLFKFWRQKIACMNLIFRKLHAI